MKMTPEMLEAGLERGKFQLWHYDHEGLYQPIKELMRREVEEWGFEYPMYERSAIGFAMHILEECIMLGLLEVPHGPTDTTPTREEFMRSVYERHGLPIPDNLKEDE